MDTYFDILIMQGNSKRNQEVKNMKHIVVDLEMNPVKKGTEERRISRNEVIEIGAVMLDENLNQIAEFRTYVKPQYNDGITKQIERLTGITDAMVSSAPDFNKALRMFTNWCLGTNEEVVIHAWSDNDYIQICKEIELKHYEKSEAEAAILDTPWDDFQHKFDKKLGFERCVGLGDALGMAGIIFDGREHDALDDARNTAELLHVFSDNELFDATLRKIEELMTPKSIDTALGSMFDFSAFLSA